VCVCSTAKKKKKNRRKKNCSDVLMNLFTQLSAWLLLFLLSLLNNRYIVCREPQLL
jgi:hypothetical protein